MAEQLKISGFKTEEELPAERAKKEKRPGESRRRRLPSARGLDVAGGFAERIISKTKVEHECRFCGKKIPVGSPAREIIEVIDGKLMVHSKDYVHINGRCPSPTD